MHHRFISVFSLVLILLVSACDSSTDPGDDRRDRGEGTLILDGTSYDFAVLACDFSGEVDQDLQTVSGRGELPDGESFDLFVSRNEINDMLIHSISFQTGNVAQGEGTVIEAQRMRINGDWTSLRDNINEPLIQISGNTLTASANFSPDDDLEDLMEGQLEATCR